MCNALEVMFLASQDIAVKDATSGISCVVSRPAAGAAAVRDCVHIRLGTGRDGDKDLVFV